MVAVGLFSREERFEVTVRVSVPGLDPEVRLLSPSDRELRELSPAPLLPVRDVHRGRPHQLGRVTQVPLHHRPGSSLVCESRFEAMRVQELVFLGQVGAIAAQPMRVRCLDEGGPGLVPDLFLVTPDGSRVLESVRPVALRDATFRRDCELLAEFARSVGWEFVVSGETTEAYGELIQLLSGYARVRVPWAVHDRVKDAFAERPEWAYAELVERCAGEDPVAHAALRALMWRRRLIFDLGEGLHHNARVTYAGALA
jgi:hypothetical protein